MTETHVHPEHRHVKFESHSMIAARVCTSCGGYVSNAHLAEHQDFHDLVTLAVNAEIASEETQVELF